MRLIVLISFLFLKVSFLYAQEIFPYDEIGKFNWTDVEVKQSLSKKEVKAEKRKVIRALFRTRLFEGWDDDNTHYHYQWMLKGIHFVNVNGDNKVDVIYCGEFQGEGTIIIILLNDGTKYRHAFDVLGRPCKLVYESNILKRMYIEHVGCCASNSTLLYRYRVECINSKLKFIKECESEILTNSKLPQKLLSKPYVKNIILKKVHLRSSPFLKNYPFDDFLEQYGNRIGVLTENTPVKIIAEEEDVQGNTWYFVEVEAKYKILKTTFYSEDYYRKIKKDKLCFAGWVSTVAFHTAVK